MILKKVHPTLLAMWIVMLAYGLVMQIIIFFVTKRWLYYSIGAWAGVALAILCSGLLLRSVVGAIDRGEKAASGYAIRCYCMRLMLIAGVFVVLAVTELGSVVTAFIGVFSMKISAYLQGYVQKLPIIRKIFDAQACV